MGNVPYAELIAVLGCVALSVLFSGSETALNALGKRQLEKLLSTLKAQDRRHRFLEIWASDRNAALSCILIGNNVVNITASALATVAFESWFMGSAASGFAVPVAVFVTSFLILTFGEIIPKTYAQNDPERFMGATRVVYPFWLLFLPATRAFAKLSESVITRAGGSVEQKDPQVTEEDIESHIERAAEQGNLDEEQKQMLSSVFEFDDINVEEIMKPRTEVTGIPRDASLQQILTIVEESGYSRYPVYGEDLDDVKGVLYTRDLLTIFGKPQGAALDLSELVRPPWAVPDSKSIKALLDDMRASRTHMAIVVDEHGGTAGVVTIEDIIEEVFGEIYDEYDDDDDEEGEDLVVDLGGGSWDVEARVGCRDLESVLDIEFPEEGDYSTVAGFIIAETGDIPNPGKQVRLGHHVFTVTDSDTTRVLRVRVDFRPEEQALLEETG